MNAVYSLNYTLKSLLRVRVNHKTASGLLPRPLVTIIAHLLVDCLAACILECSHRFHQNLLSLRDQPSKGYNDD